MPGRYIRPARIADNALLAAVWHELRIELLETSKPNVVRASATILGRYVLNAHYFVKCLICEVMRMATILLFRHLS